MNRHRTQVCVLLACLVCVLMLAIGCKAEPEATAHTPAAHEGSIAEGLDCSNCHTPDGWAIGEGSSSGNSSGGFDHARTGFPLTGQHTRVACTDCHRPREAVRRDCVSCHEDEHQGRLGDRCDGCHTSRGFQLTRALEMHRQTEFPLTGMHALADCTECHQRRGERFLSDVPSDCFSCHEDDYRRTDVHPVHVGTASSAPFPRDCSQCHRPIGWPFALINPSSVGRSSGALRTHDHDLFFPIAIGPHQNAPCESCHLSASAPHLIRCTGCHAHNPVQVQLHHPNQQVTTDGSGCLSCHVGGAPR